jgi:hypothetical protein
MTPLHFQFVATLLLACAILPANADGPELVAHWPLESDARDAGPHELHGEADGVTYSLDAPPKMKGSAAFDGRKSRIAIPLSEHLDFSNDDFTIALWVKLKEALDDVPGDLVSKFDPAAGRGFSLSFLNNQAATTSPGNFQALAFSADDGRIEPAWTDRGRPGDALLIFALATHRGELYAGTTEAGSHATGRVYRYRIGDNGWIDLGSPDGSNSVTALASLGGELYAATGKYRLRGSSLPESENETHGGRVFRLKESGEWEDCGKLDTEAIASLVVYRDALYVSSLYSPGVWRFEGGAEWTAIGTPNNRRVEAMTVWNGSIWGGGYDAAEIYRYSPEAGWQVVGSIPECTQTYGFAIFGGRLYVGTWPTGSVWRYEADGVWTDCGRLGDEKETMAMAVYNGALYAGTLPLAQVYRYAGARDWDLVGRVDETPDVVYRRAWSMAVHGGELFVGTLPSGRVKSMRSGAVVIRNAAPIWNEWRHVAAAREGGKFTLYVDGVRSNESYDLDFESLDLRNAAPLTLGFGPQDYFAGSMADVRIYRGAMSESEISTLMSRQ